MTSRQELSRQRVGLAIPDHSDTHYSNGERCPTSTRPQDCASARPARPGKHTSARLCIGAAAANARDTATTAPAEDCRTGGATSYTVVASVEDWRRRAAAQVENRSRGSYKGKLHFFLKFFLENEIFLDKFKFLVPTFSNFDCIFLFILEVDSDSLFMLQIFFLKCDVSRVEGYVTPSYTKCQKSEKI